MTYTATFSANNGATYSSEPFKDTNLARLVKTMKDIVRGNHHTERYNTSCFEVCDERGFRVSRFRLVSKQYNFHKF